MNKPKNLINAFGHILVVLSIIFIFVKLVHHFNEIPEFSWGPGAMLSFISAVMFSAAVILISAYVWRILLRGGGFFLSLKQAYVIIGQVQIAKYLPGNFIHYIGRVAFGRRYGISSEAIVISMGVETLLLVVAASAIATIGFFFNSQAPAWLIEEMGIKILPIHIIGVVLLISILAVTVFLSHRIRDWVYQRLAYLHIGRISTSVLIYMSEFVLFGMIISLILHSLWDVDNTLQWYQFIWGFALAWILGFITPGSPGGIGIREIVFVGLYGKELGDGLAIGLAVVLRIITSLGDLLAFGIAYLIGKRDNNVNISIKP